MNREICITLTTAEARAWADGATCLIRPVKFERCFAQVRYSRAIDRDMPVLPKWQTGDILIGREAWCVPGRHVLRHARTAFRVDQPDADDGLYRWRSAVTMPKALARHRYPAVSVRVCRWQDVTTHERRQTRMKDFGYLRAGADTYVSVTMLDHSNADPT